MTPKNLARLVYLVGVLAVVSLIGFCASACGGKALPKLPDLVITSDKDYRAVEAKTYAILKPIGDLLNEADQLETAANAASPVPGHAAFHAAVVKLAQQGHDLIVSIDAHALGTWAALKAKLQPVLDGIESIRKLIQPGFSWAALVEGIANVALVFVQPGFAGGR